MKKYISLLLVLFLVSGCSFSFNINKNKEQKEEKKEETSVNTVFYEAAQKIIVNDLLDMVSVGTCGVESGLDFTNSNKLTVNELEDNYKYSMAYYNLYGYGIVNQVSKNDLSNSYEKIFGLKPTLPEQFGASHVWLGFGINSNSDYYSVVAGGGGCGGFNSHYLLDSYNLVDNNLYFNVIYYIKGASFDANGEFKGVSISNNKVQEKVTFEIESTGEEITDVDIEKVKTNKDKFTQYRFNFKLNDDHYIFDSVEKIN